MTETRGHGGFDSSRIALAFSIARSQVEAVLRYTASAADREDVTARAIERVWRNRGSLRVDERFPGWVRQIARNAAFDYLRERVPEAPLDPHLDEPDPSDPERELRRSEFRRLLLLALARLPEAQREIWILKEVEGLSYKDIAEIRGISSNTVGPSIAAARQRLITELSALGFVP